MKRLAIVALILLALVGCSGPDSGYVTGKRFTPAHSWTWCHFVGKVYLCSPMYVGDEWELKLKSGDDEGWTDVDQHTYDTTKVGDFYRGTS